MKKRIGIVFWEPGNGICIQNSRLIQSLGYESVDFLYNQVLPDKLDAVFVQGPWASLAPLGKQLLSQPSGQRVKLVFWMLEQFDNPALPEFYRRSLGEFRSCLDQLGHYQKPDGTWHVHSYLAWLENRAFRIRFYGDLFWLRRHGLLTVLASHSPYMCEFLGQRGFKMKWIENSGYYPEWAADLKLERDIPVLWLGKNGTNRRRRILDRLEGELSDCGIPLLRIDGERHPYVFDQERTILLNRSKIALNILRQNWDNNSMRFHLAAPNRAMIISEPMLRHHNLVPGTHIVEVPIEEIPEQILYYLSHDEDRQQMVERAYQLVTKTTRREAIGELLALAFDS